MAKSLQQSKYSSKFLQTKTDSNQIITKGVYQGKQKKNVCNLSTLHTFVIVNSTSKKKLETVTFYNKTKCGVDIADQMAWQYMVKAGTWRWLVPVFYNILDLARINAHVSYKQ